jgi:hypothetical protein
MRGIATSAALAILFLPALALGQEPVKSFDQLNTRLKSGDKIVVTDTQGREHQGKLVELSASSLTLDRVGKLAASDVRMVQERAHDSLKDGALIGLASGLTLGAIAAADCAGGDCEFSPAAVFAMVGGVYGGLGAAVGAGIDALIPGKKRVVYRAPDGTAGTRVTLAPVVTPRAKGIAVSFTF